MKRKCILWVKVVKIHGGEGDGEMEKEDEGEAVAETGMLGFVVPDFHAEEGTEAAAKEGNGDETGFRDAPFVMAGFPFVDAVQEEGNEVNRHKIEQKAIYEIFSHFLIYSFSYFRICQLFNYFFVGGEPSDGVEGGRGEPSGSFVLQ